MATLQVKGLDDQLYKALGARAAMDNRSVSQEVVTMIQEYLARPKLGGREATRAFLELAGSWADAKPAVKIALAIRSARRSRRRFRKAGDVFD